MSEQNTQINTEPGAQSAEPSTPPAAQTTGEPAPNKDGEPVKTLELTQDSLNAMNADARKRGEESILKKFGITDKAKLADTVAAYNAYLEAEKNKQTDGDKLKTVSGELEQLKNDHTALLSELSGLKQKDILRGHGLDEKADPITFKGYYSAIIELVTDDLDFEGAAEKFIKDNPVKKPDEPAKPPEGALLPGYIGRGTADKSKTDLNKIFFGGGKKSS
jgi:hypothetical protein